MQKLNRYYKTYIYFVFNFTNYENIYFFNYFFNSIKYQTPTITHHILVFNNMIYIYMFVYLLILKALYVFE